MIRPGEVDPEYRLDKPGEERPGAVCHPNGSIVASGSAWFEAASACAVLELHDELRAAK